MVSPSATERRVTSSLPVAEVESVPPVPPSPESAQPDTAAKAATSSRRTIRAGMTARSRVPFLSLCVWKDTEINYQSAACARNESGRHAVGDLEPLPRILCSMVAKLAKRDLEVRLEAENAEISGLAYAVLAALRHRQATSAEISRKMMLTPATLVPVVDTLEEQGLVERRQDPDDRRRTPLFVTPAGRSLLERVPLVDDTDSLVVSLENLGEEATHDLLHLLRQLAISLYGNEQAIKGIAAAARTQCGKTPENSETGPLC